MPLSPAAHAFTTHLAATTGLNPRVIAGWVMAETSGHNTTNGPNNWLNVGSFDSGFVGGGANAWNNPVTAANATAAFMLGRPVGGIRPPLGGGSSSIRGILSTVGKGVGAQVAAIQNSDWASSHYGGNLMADVRPFLGQNFNVGQSGFPVSGTQVTGPTAIGKPPKTVSASYLQHGPQQPTKASILGSYLANEPSINPWGDTAQSPLITAGLLPTSVQMKSPVTRVTLKAQNALQGLAGNTGLKVHPQAVGKFSGYVNPIRGATLGRTDMGVDLNMRVGAPIRAIGDSKVVNIYPNWFQGQPYILLKLLNGPKAGKYYYVAEQIAPSVKPGQVLHAGDTIGTYASSGTGIEMGWGTPSESTLAQATTGYSEGQVTGAGSSFRNFLGSLGAR